LRSQRHTYVKLNTDESRFKQGFLDVVIRALRFEQEEAKGSRIQRLVVHAGLLGETWEFQVQTALLMRAGHSTSREPSACPLCYSTT
jgi:hypothetical protein